MGATYIAGRTGGRLGAASGAASFVSRTQMIKPSRTDAFPKTPRSWIRTQLERGEDGRAEANRHIMHAYAKPLSVYFRGSSYRTLGDADEIVNAFFVDRLSRHDYLSSWEISERPMRYWLLVGFKYFLMEQASGRNIADSGHGQRADDTQHHDPASEFHREVARSVVREAANIAQASCQKDGLGEHWHLWVRHHLYGRSLRELAADHDYDFVRVKVMTRTASNRFRRALRELVSWPGATRTQVDDEIRELMQSLSKGAS